MGRTTLRAALLCAAAFTLTPATAGAVVAGTPDTANRYSNVAVLRFLDIDGDTRWRCSGTLIAPNVIITAAHCTEGAEQVFYSFAVTRPTVEPDAPGATGWTLGGDNSVAGEQNIYTHPDWDGDLQNNSLDDIGVIILDSRSPASRSRRSRPRATRSSPSPTGQRSPSSATASPT